MAIKFNTENRAVFLCSPNVGLLDNWLPVLERLKTNYGYSITIILPTEFILRGLFGNNLIHLYSEKIFDEFVFKVDSFSWKIASELPVTARQSNLRKLIITIKRLIFNFGKKLRRNPFFKRFGLTILSWEERSFLNIYRSGFFKKSNLILYDVYEDRKEYNRQILKELNDRKKFSISHALSLPSLEFKVEGTDSLDQKKSVVCFVFSNRDVSKYQKVYSIPKGNIYVTGIPRHSNEWVEKVLLESSETSRLGFKSYVLLISRPSNEFFYLSRAHKIQFLEEINELIIQERKLKLIIKRHPGEEDDELFKIVLGEDAFNKEWFFSNQHPYHLARDAELVITFFSGISIDMACLKVPCIERTNLSDLEGHRHDQDYINRFGEVISPYSYCGLTYNARSKDAFSFYIENCINQPNEMTERTYQNYKNIFPVREDCVDFICSVIDEEVRNN